MVSYRGRVAAWPRGRVAAWPRGRVAAWPRGRVMITYKVTYIIRW